MNDHAGAPHVAEPEIEEAFHENMDRIALAERERQTQQLASASGLGYINLVGFPIGPETISIIPRADAVRLKTVCFLKTGNQIRLGTVDFSNPDLAALVDALGRTYRSNVELYLVSQHSYDSAMKMYDRLPKIIPQANELRLSASDIEKFQSRITDLRQLDQELHGASMTDTFIILIAAALVADASDIHVEAESEGVRVRYRLDGVLTPVSTLPTESWPRIIARIKLLAHLKLNITTAPQDGRITILLPNETIDVRVSTLPTAYGESVVLRILRPSSTTITLNQLGLRGRALAAFEAEIQKPNGMIVVTGPTGSGKTTTLYAAVKQLNTPDTKIITLEDPIEYKLEGINQSQVDNAKGYTFATGLRSILRQDPDIILVGEIRDLETAETAIQASLTGHLVLSTVHTNDAAGAVPRFLSMGAKPYLLAPALNAVVAQRLVRKICPNCAKDTPPSPEQLSRIRAALESIPTSSEEHRTLPSDLTLKAPVGCDQCHGTGYRGRIGIFEIILIDAEAEKLILTGAVSEYQVREMAERQGALTMLQDGILKALDGVTSLEEIERVA